MKYQSIYILIDWPVFTRINKVIIIVIIIIIISIKSTSLFSLPVE